MSEKKKVENWNRRHPVGSDVLLRKDDRTEVRTKTRSEAQLLGGHTAVIWLEGVTGAYALDNVRSV